jgi:hypothetical protein
MTYKIHFEHSDGTPDYFVVSAETIQGIRTRALEEIAKRGGKNPWSEEVLP